MLEPKSADLPFSLLKLDEGILKMPRGTQTNSSSLQRFSGIAYGDVLFLTSPRGKNGHFPFPQFLF